jgi:L-alanine-DL-glutamate epimerase-like enolase superfamily enzyme
MAIKSLGELLGGIVRREVPFYVVSGRRDTTPEHEVDYLLRLIAIHADANSSYDPPKAIVVGRMLEEIKAVYFEEPCPFDHLEDTRRVAEALTIPVALGEQEASEWQFRWQIHHRVMDIVQPDLHYYGGMIRSLRVARMAALAQMPTTVHISGGFGFVYMLHFASCTPHIGPYQEYKQKIETYRNWFDPPLKIQRGAIAVPQGAGVGIANLRDFLRDAKPAK